ncbi:MAG TPA: DGQHR domain-containing protein [Patescibacteria group bacterium]|nr:DGQHR domain-containing protein [Patescibacteria group bacterium]
MLAPFIHVQQARRSFFLTALPASFLVRISYAAVRRQDEEEGSVQRVLNPSRIIGIKAFALQDGDFPASIALNWVGAPLITELGNLVIPDAPRSAQILDGQHRVAGLGEAIQERQELATQMIPVAIYSGLDTRECANIFLSINTEQKPVPKSLVYDLYGIASAELIDQAADRARDITVSLNEPGQAYDGLIKFPNTPRRRGGIALSTAVSAIKPLVTEKGTLDQIGASSLEMQRQIVQNFFSVLSSKYGERWTDPTNAFLYAGGFIGALEFLHLKIIPYCILQGSFETSIIAKALRLEESDMIRQEEIKGLGGRDAPKRVFDRLVDAFQPAENAAPKFRL